MTIFLAVVQRDTKPESTKLMEYLGDLSEFEGKEFDAPVQAIPMEVIYPGMPENIHGLLFRMQDPVHSSPNMHVVFPHFTESAEDQAVMHAAMRTLVHDFALDGEEYDRIRVNDPATNYCSQVLSWPITEQAFTKANANFAAGMRARMYQKAKGIF